MLEMKKYLHKNVFNWVSVKKEKKPKKKKHGVALDLAWELKWQYNLL